tara:strand:- start:788 stop:2398 length:1611 start_codon:yes stop_codon:yes gene_type:complete
MTSSFTPKDLVWDDEGRRKLTEGITKLSKAVKSTLGPSGNTVLIESEAHTHGITVTKDGVTVAKSIDLLDPVENLAVRMMKEAAEKTANLAGDGTTTAIVLTEAIVSGAIGLMAKSKEPVSAVALTRRIDDICEGLLSLIESRAIPVTDEMLFDVATISANNDKELGKVISDIYLEVGKEGIVTVERSDTPETTTEVIKGIRVDRGYASPLFVNDQRRDQCIMDDVRVLISDAEISNVLSIEKILKPIIQQQQKLLIIAPCSTNVVNTLAANVMKNGLKLCTIEPPSFGYRTHELMSDISLTVGGTYFSQKTGDDLSIIEESDLGIAKRVVVSNDNTIIIREDDIDTSGIDGRIAELWAQRDTLTKKHERDFVLERIASLSGGIGVISVGGHTDLEQKERFDRVDDAVCAVRAALADGIVAGGGVTLNGFRAEIDTGDTLVDEMAAEVMGVALGEPARQILMNSGMTERQASDITNDMSDTEGMNVKTGQFGDMVEMGVIDPAKVTKTALRSAVSVANTILSTNAIVTMARTYESK